MHSSSRFYSIRPPASRKVNVWYCRQGAPFSCAPLLDSSSAPFPNSLQCSVLSSFHALDDATHGFACRSRRQRCCPARSSWMHRKKRYAYPMRRNRYPVPVGRKSMHFFFVAFNLYSASLLLVGYVWPIINNVRCVSILAFCVRVCICVFSSCLHSFVSAGWLQVDRAVKFADTFWEASCHESFGKLDTDGFRASLREASIKSVGSVECVGHRGCARGSLWLRGVKQATPLVN